MRQIERIIFAPLTLLPLGMKRGNPGKIVATVYLLGSLTLLCLAGWQLFGNLSNLSNPPGNTGQEQV